MSQVRQKKTTRRNASNVRLAPGTRIVCRYVGMVGGKKSFEAKLYTSGGRWLGTHTGSSAAVARKQAVEQAKLAGIDLVGPNTPSFNDAYPWVRKDRDGVTRQATPTCSHCNSSDIWTEDQIKSGASHTTVKRCANCGKLSHFVTPKEDRWKSKPHGAKRR